jgi:hypothetical protein
MNMVDSIITEHDEMEVDKTCISMQTLLKEAMGIKIPSDDLPVHLGGPLAPKISRKRTGEERTRKIHLVKTDGMAIGCAYNAQNYAMFTEQDAAGFMDSQEENGLCKRCFECFTWPAAWEDATEDAEYQLAKEQKPKADGEPEVEDSDDSSNLGSSGDSEETNDSLSEAEALVPDEG